MKSYKFILLVLLLLCNNVNSQVSNGKWEKISGYESLNSVCFVSTNIGYAVGLDGVILKTTDAGITWNKVQTSTLNALNKLRFINSNVGFAVGENGTILKTIDGGDNWVVHESGVINTLNDIFFIDTIHECRCKRYCST